MNHGNKKREIIRAVEELAANRTLNEVTLDEVARTAKIGKGTIYHYFKDKEDLLFEVAASGFDELCETLRQKAPANDLFLTKFYNICGEIIRFFANRQQLLKMIQDQTHRTFWSKNQYREKWVSRKERFVSVVSDILSQGMAEGIIRSDLSVTFMATSLLGMLEAHIEQVNSNIGPIQGNEFIVSLFLNGACNGDSKPINHKSEALQGDKYIQLNVK